MKPLSMFAALLLVALLAPSSSAQGILQRTFGLGDVVAGVGDLDGDAHPDILVGRTGRHGLSGQVQLISILDGTTLRMHAGSAVDDGFATAVAALGDVDGDGVGDYAISTTGGAAPGVDIHSGASGLVLRTLLPPAGAGPFGTVMNAEGDLDGDQVRDLLITSAPTTAGVPPEVWVYSGRTGALLRSHQGGSWRQIFFGGALSILGDVDGDGKDDYAIGNQHLQATSRGEVSVFSGASGALRYKLVGAPFASFGASISGIGDVDGDGHADIVIGAPNGALFPDRSGEIHVHSGFDGHALFRVDAPQELVRSFGQSVLGIEDYDGDGTPDFLGFSPEWGAEVVFNRNRVCVFSGSNGSMLDWVFGFPRVQFEGGTDGPVVSAGDLNSDGHADWLIGAAGGINGYATVVLRNAKLPKHSDLWPIACHNGAPNSLGCVPQLDWSSASSLSIGQEPRVSASKLMPNAIGFLLWSPFRSSLPFGTGSLCVGSAVRRTATISTGGVNGTCTGSLSFTFARTLLSSQGFSAGSELVVQGWCRDAGFAPPLDRTLTPAVAFTLWP